MKNIYKCLLTALLVSAAASLFAFGSDVVDVSRLQGQLQNTIEEAVNERPLYSFVKQELSTYYGREDFADPNRQTGWYRVDNFLKWIQDNEEELSKSIVNISDTQHALKELYTESNYSTYYSPFWAYLGARYIANIYGVNSNLDKIKLIIACGKDFTFAGTGEIFLCTHENEVSPSVINTGLHETTHMLAFLRDDADYGLSELATFYSTYNYGLPVKSADALSLGDGVRDIRRTAALRPDMNILYEYNYYLAGLILNQNIKPQDIFSFIDESPNYKISIKNYCFNSVALKDNNFFSKLIQKTGIPLLEYYFNEQDLAAMRENMGKTLYFGKRNLGGYEYDNLFVKPNSAESMEYVTTYEGTDPINIKQFLQNMLGNHYSSKINMFYMEIYNGLPQEFIDKVNQQFPAQNARMYTEWKADEMFAEYDSDILAAVLKALNQMNIPQAAIPEGYI